MGNAAMNRRLLIFTWIVFLCKGEPWTNLHIFSSMVHMDMLNQIGAAFLGFLGLFTIIGVLSARKAKGTAEDYYLAGRSINPWFMALSAVATNNSGFMFIGLIGVTYLMGYAGAWIMIGWIAGDYLSWFFVHRRLREQSEERRVTSFPGFLGVSKRGRSRLLVVIAAVITFIFLSVYAAAQLKAGSKALHVLFGWNYSTGAIMGALIVLIYCFSGGIRASIWTDVVQSLVMMMAMLLLIAVTLYHTGGITGLHRHLLGLDPNLVRFLPSGSGPRSALWIFGWVGAGFGTMGQPHIMVRAMTLRSATDIKKARLIYFVWFTLFTAAAIGVGLSSRVLIPLKASFDAELALPTISMAYLPGPLIGLILAGLFSATMSTADSQILSCSAALTCDIFPRLSERLWAIKAGTVFVTGIVLFIALFAQKNVFSLVTISWAALAAGLGPLLLVRLFRRTITEITGALMMLGGVTTVVLWVFVFNLSGVVYEVVPGMIVGTLIWALSRTTLSGGHRP